MNEINHGMFFKKGVNWDLSIAGMDVKVVKSLYRFMLRLRRCQEALLKEYHPADEMRCPIHFCIGQEAAPAALSQLLLQEDYLLSHHRSHGYYLSKGAPMNALFAEIYGRETGANGGVAGSQDISMHEVNFCSGAILSGAIAIAVGVALNFSIKKNKNVAIAGFGDGATDQGIFWESMNYAALQKLPVVFICENNHFSTYSPQFKRQSNENISERVASFGVHSQKVFGNDVAASYKAIAGAVARARAGEGPSFIETITYRMNPHVGPEDDDYLNYRSKDEIALWRRNCPITLLEKAMIAGDLLSSAEKEQMVGEIDKEIEDAFAFAKKSAFPQKVCWEKLNYSVGSPLADKLLQDIDSQVFDQNQKDTIPGPY